MRRIYMKMILPTKTKNMKKTRQKTPLKIALLWIHFSMPIEREIGEEIIKRKILAEISALNTNK